MSFFYDHYGIIECSRNWSKGIVMDENMSMEVELLRKRKVTKTKKINPNPL